MEKDKNVEKIESLFRVPDEVADKVQVGVEIVRGGYELFETRPRWDNPKAAWTKLPVAKFVYHRPSKSWRLYWMRASGKWNRYPTRAKILSDILRVIEQDKLGCFWG